jgi:glycosyltransferase involved in cell wall biosynthesis
VLFWLVGDGMKKNALIAEAMRRNLQNIRFSDPVSKEEVVDCILAADIGISVLKKAEIFKTVYSNKTFDYFSCKKPVLVAIDGVSRKLVEEARAGWYVEPESPVGIVAGICMYMENPELIRIHGENGYRYAKGHFDREKLALEYLKLMEEIVEDN